MTKIQEGESVDLELETIPVWTVAQGTYIATHNAAFLNAMWRAAALQLVAAAYYHDRPEGWEELHTDVMLRVDDVCRAVGAMAGVDTHDSALMCDGRFPAVYQGRVGDDQVSGAPLWRVGRDPVSIDEFPETNRVPELLERATFLDALHDRARLEGGPHAVDLDAEHIGLLRAAAWERLAEHDVQRLLLVGEGIGVVTWRGQPRALMGRIGPADNRPSLAEMTVGDRIRFIQRIGAEFERMCRFAEPLPSDFCAPLDGSGTRRLWALTRV